jgi:nitrate/nitrite-specific signal transduction histidine kinase
MNKISSRITLPVVLSGLFATTIFVALNYQELQWTFYVVVLLLTFFIFFFGYAIGQKFGAPVKKILEKATDLSEGNYSVRVYLETKDELADLAEVFNRIAEELEQIQTEKENTEKTVDMKVRAKTQVLEETISALEQKVKNRTAEMERLMKQMEGMRQEVVKENQAAIPKKEIKLEE